MVVVDDQIYTPKFWSKCLKAPELQQLAYWQLAHTKCQCVLLTLKPPNSNSNPSDTLVHIVASKKNCPKLISSFWKLQHSKRYWQFVCTHNEWMNEWMVGSQKFSLPLSSLLMSFSPDLLVGKEKNSTRNRKNIFFINSFEIWSLEWILVSASRNKKNLNSEWKQDFFKKAQTKIKLSVFVQILCRTHILKLALRK